MYQRLVNQVLTHRDYGPIREHSTMRFFPSLSPRRLNFAFARGELARHILNIR
jgi:hypothetical protein